MLSGKSKKLLAVILAAAIVLSFPWLSFRTEAKEFTVDWNISSDLFVYAPAVYDLKVTTDAEDPTFQWMAAVGANPSDGEFIELDDRGRWGGTQTDHLTLITDDGMSIYDEGGWYNIAFNCKVTDKYGSTFWADSNMRMKVYTHQDLLDKLEEEGVLFTDHGIVYDGGGSLEFVKEEDGIKYYNSYSDTGLIPYYDYKEISSETAYAADGEIKVETIVIDGGKAVRYDALLNGFVPQKYGQGSLTFGSDLVLYVSGERMETLDTVTSVVNVRQPEGIGAALTKSSCAVLEGQYSQSQALTTLAINERVTILADAGGYYRVAAGGYFGYVPKTALNVIGDITTVSVHVQAPAAYAGIDVYALLGEAELYIMESKWNKEIWYDKTADKYPAAGDVFLPNHEYTLTIWLTATAGNRFAVKDGQSGVAAYINGISVSAQKAYEQDPEDVIEISYNFDHVHDLQKVNRVYPSCTKDGKELYYHCSICGRDFEDFEARVPITSSDWGVIPALGHRESAWRSNGSEHYKICLRRECGEVIEGSLGTHTGGEAFGLSAAVCSVCGLSYGEKADPGKPVFKGMENKLVKYNDVWIYIGDDATQDLSFTGLVQNEYGWWYVNKGFVDFNYTGLVQNENGWWYVENGGINFNAFNLLVQNENGWWIVDAGGVNFAAEGIYQNEYGWWYVKGGKVQFGYTGIRPNQNGWWYVKGGKVQFGYSGPYTYQNQTWNVVNGKAY